MFIQCSGGLKHQLQSGSVAIEDMFNFQNALSPDEILRCLDIDPAITPAAAEPFRIHLDPSKYSSGEMNFQQVFNDENKDNPYLALDSFKTSAGLPFFMPLQAHTVSQTAKPDVVSTVLPMIMEFKTSSTSDTQVPQEKEWEVLIQCMDRLLAQTAVFGYLSRFIAFAFTNRASWVLMYSHLPSGSASALRETIQIAGVHRAHVAELWGHISCFVAKTKPKYHLIDEAPLIFKALRALQLDLMSTRVVLAGQSMHKVFRVKCAKGKTIGVIDYDFALKVILDDDSYARESVICEEMHKRTQAALSKPDFYVNGCIPAGGAENIWRQVTGTDIVQAFRNMKIDYASSSWWDYADIGCLAGGALYMDYGIPWDDVDDNHSKAEVDSIRLAVYRCLHLLHDSERPLVHRDIRKSNLLQIRGKWHLIDFGEAGNAGELIKLEPGGRLDRVGPHVREYRLTQGEQCLFPWHISDDWEMIDEMLTMLRQ